MDLPFPVLWPRFIFSDWFNADNPCDEDAELTELEQAHQRWLNSFTTRRLKHTPAEKPESEPVYEVETEYDGGDEDAEESEDSHDVDEEEQINTTESPEQNATEQEQANLDDTTPNDDVGEIIRWPLPLTDDYY